MTDFRGVDVETIPQRPRAPYMIGVPVAVRFWAKVDREAPNGCWEWRAALRQGTGYGTFRIDGKSVSTHRWSYEQMVGPVPSGLQLDHLCRNRACVNPSHLEPVTPAENVRRSHGNGAKRECPQGHPYDAANTYTQQGRRGCRTCRAARSRAWRAA